MSAMRMVNRLPKGVALRSVEKATSALKVALDELACSYGDDRHMVAEEDARGAWRYVVKAEDRLRMLRQHLGGT